MSATPSIPIPADSTVHRQGRLRGRHRHRQRRPRLRGGTLLRQARIEPEPLSFMINPSIFGRLARPGHLRMLQESGLVFVDDRFGVSERYAEALGFDGGVHLKIRYHVMDIPEALAGFIEGVPHDMAWKELAAPGNGLILQQIQRAEYVAVRKNGFHPRE